MDLNYVIPGKVYYLSLFFQDREGSPTGRSVMYEISAVRGAAKILDYEAEVVMENGRVVGLANTALRSPG